MPILLAKESAHALNFVRAGRRGASPVVLVHAIGLDLTFWGEQLAALGSDFDVIAYDLLGHGNSSAPPHRYDLDSMAADLAAVIEGVVGTAAHVIGVSLGGMIAQTLAVKHPGLVRSLSLIDTSATFSDQARELIRQRAQATRLDGMEAMLQQTIERWFTHSFTCRRPDVIDRVSKTLQRNSSTVHAATWDAISKLDVAPLLSSLQCPTLVMVGEKDSTTPVAASRLIADQIRGAHLHVLPGISHMSPIEAPLEVSSRLLDFLRSL